MNDVATREFSSGQMLTDLVTGISLIILKTRSFSCKVTKYPKIPRFCLEPARPYFEAILCNGVGRRVIYLVKHVPEALSLQIVAMKCLAGVSTMFNVGDGGASFNSNGSPFQLLRDEDFDVNDKSIIPEKPLSSEDTERDVATSVVVKALL